ncbi:hypothetical protein KP509_34G057600 [Ceratopteris richardii]|nr:hypothetical protein KP509_34G057600 [Ceratopteris richardii]
MYAKCSAVADAQNLFDKLSVRDSFSWNSLIVGYAHDGQVEAVLYCFEQMENEGFYANEVTYICILKSCSSIKAVNKGEQIFVKMIMKQGLQGDETVIGTVLMNVYAKGGAFAKAQQLLEKLPRRDIVSWNSLMAGFVHEGQGAEAIMCFDKICNEGLSPNSITFTCALKACGNIGDLYKGIMIHNAILKEGLLASDAILGSSLVDMYIKCGAFSRARRVLVDTPIMNIVMWNSLMTSYIEHRQEVDALNCLQWMRLKGITPDKITYICILMACGNLRALEIGKEIHYEVVESCLIDKDVALGNALVDMYVRCGALDRAHHVLEELPTRDVVSWSSLIAGYAQQGKGQDAVYCFLQMQKEGLSPNAVTFTSLLKACGYIGAADLGEQIHDEIVRLHLLKDSNSLGNALIDMYSKCGAFSKAIEVLDQLPKQDVVAWNALISGYIQEGKNREALDCFGQMECKSVSPDDITYTCILKACGSLGIIDEGEQIHHEISRKGRLKQNLVLANALVDMYVNCGKLKKARQLLETLPARNVVSWSTLIAGYAQEGQGHEALQCFVHMQDEDILPNSITISNVIGACSHAGLIDEGKLCYLSMHTTCGIVPVFEHHSCIIDLLVRSGNLNEALAMIESMPSEVHPIVWSAILTACQSRGDVTVGKWAFEHTTEINDDVTPYISMSNLYAALGLCRKAEEVEFMRQTRVKIH